jgi:hypothetical protein
MAEIPVSQLIPQVDLEGQSALYVLDSGPIACTVVTQKVDASADVNLSVEHTNDLFSKLISLPAGAQIGAAVGSLDFVVESVTYGDQPGQWYAESTV